MLFVLFLLLNFALYVRPEELFGDFAGGRFYMVVMCAVLPVAAGRIARRLARLQDDPVSCCVLVFYAAAFASRFFKLGVEPALAFGEEFGKVVLAYLVGLAALSEPRNYVRYLVALPLLIAGIAGVGLLQFHGVIEISAFDQIIQRELDADGGIIAFARLSSSGVFNDPNDLCLMLAVGLAICAYHLIERSNAIGMLVSVALIPLFLYALILTRSRGGLLAVAAMSASLFLSRFGSRVGVPLIALGMAGLLAVSGGRQTSIDATTGTAQDRVKLWSQGLEAWKESPLLGIGAGQYPEVATQVAHNSYVHALVETGIWGGLAFVGIYGCFFFGLRGTPSLDDADATVHEEQAASSRPYVLAALAGYCMGMFSLSRNYIIPTYMMAALGNACLSITHPRSAQDWYAVNAGMMARIIAFGLFVMAVCVVFVKVFVRYG